MANQIFIICFSVSLILHGVFFAVIRTGGARAENCATIELKFGRQAITLVAPPNLPPLASPTSSASPPEITEALYDPPNAVSRPPQLAAPQNSAENLSGVKTVVKIAEGLVLEYPYAARLKQEEGVSICRVEVDENGNAVAVSLITSSGFSLLDEAALAALRRARYTPAAVAVQDFTIRFRLNDE